MKTILVALTLASSFLGCSLKQRIPESTVKEAGGTVGQFRGYLAINNQLRARLFSVDTSPAFNLGRYFNENNDSMRGLSAMLGGFQSNSGTSEFQNGTPNAMNTLLWQLALDGLANDFSRVCTQGSGMGIGSAKLDATFASRISRMCTWPAEDAKSPSAMLDIWMSIMGFDAPESAYEDWQASILAQNSVVLSMTGAKAVRSVLLLAFLDPHFLLVQ